MNALQQQMKRKNLYIDHIMNLCMIKPFNKALILLVRTILLQKSINNAKNYLSNLETYPTLIALCQHFNLSYSIEKRGIQLYYERLFIVLETSQKE